MTRRNPDQRQEQHVEQPERVIATHPRKHGCERRDNARALCGDLDKLKCGHAVTRWGPLFHSLVQQKQWRDEHDNADCIADPKMKLRLRKTAPWNNARSGIS